MIVQFLKDLLAGFLHSWSFGWKLIQTSGDAAFKSFYTKKTCLKDIFVCYPLPKAYKKLLLILMLENSFQVRLSFKMRSPNQCLSSTFFNEVTSTENFYLFWTILVASWFMYFGRGDLTLTKNDIETTMEHSSKNHLLLAFCCASIRSWINKFSISHKRRRQNNVNLPECPFVNQKKRKRNESLNPHEWVDEEIQLKA